MTNTEQTPEAVPAEEAENEQTSRITALEKEVSDMKDRALRALAETDNIRKRAQRDVEETTKYAVSGIAKDMVGVAENLSRALASLPEIRSEAVKPLAEGVELTLSEFLNVLERHGIRRIDPIGEKFDPNYHQAMLQLDVPDTAAGTIVQVLQAGYMLHERLLRPAMVGVARASNESKRVDATA